MSAGGPCERHRYPQVSLFVANKGAVPIIDFLFGVSLVPSELLCPLWLEKFVQIGWIGSLWPVTQLHHKRNKVFASFFKISSFWLMKAWNDNCCTYILGTKFWKTTHLELSSKIFTELRRLLWRITLHFKKSLIHIKAQKLFALQVGKEGI